MKNIKQLKFIISIMFAVVLFSAAAPLSGAADTTSPSVIITCPTDGNTYSSATISLSGTAYDNVGVSKVEVKVGSGVWQTVTGTGSWEISGLVLVEGENTISARATDTAGNTKETSIQMAYDPTATPSPGGGGDVKIWDTNIPGGEISRKFYIQMKDSLAWENRENWIQVPYGTTDYTFIGDPIIDDGNFWLHLHSCDCNSPMLYAAGSGELYGELYGMSWYPSGSPECIPNYWPDGSARCGFQNMCQRSVTIVKNEPDEVIMIQDAGGSWPDKNVAQFRVKANAGWLEETAKTPGADYGFRIHYAPNRWAVAPANDGIGNDYIIDPRKDTPVCQPQSPPKRFVPPSTNNQFALYYMLGTTFAMLIPSDPTISGSQTITTSYEPQKWANCEPRPRMESIGTGKTLMGQNAAYIAPMPLRNIFKNAGGKDGINTHISAGGTYTVSWTPSVPGKYRMTGRVNVGGTVKTKTYTCDPSSLCPVPNPVTLPVVEGGTPNFKTTEVTNGNFVFTSPVTGILEDVVIYLYDRTAATPADIQTPMDVYRDIMGKSSFTLAPPVCTAPTPDTAAPSITIVCPNNNQIYRNPTASVSGTASDNIAVDRVEVRVDSGAWQLADGLTTWVVPELTLALGSNTIYARSTDTAGNTKETSITVTYDPNAVAVPSPSGGDAKVWDTMVKDYDKFYAFDDSLAWANKANWKQVPYGTTNYNFIGSPVLEEGSFWLYLHETHSDSPFLYANVNGVPGTGAELYGYYSGYTYPSYRYLSTEILVNTPNEIKVKYISSDKNWGKTDEQIPEDELNTITYRIVKGGGWVEVKRADPYDGEGYIGSIHCSPNRIGVAPSNDENGNDMVVDPYAVWEGLERESFKIISRNTPSTHNKMTLQDVYWYSGSHSMFVLIDTAPSSRNAFHTTYETTGPPRLHAMSGEIGPGDHTNALYYGVVSHKDVFHTENIGPIDPDPYGLGVLTLGISINAGGTYQSTFTPPIPGLWRMSGRVNGEWYISNVVNGDFKFTSPVSGKLDTLIMYLYDRTAATPADVNTPMDIYRDIMGQPFSFSDPVCTAPTPDTAAPTPDTAAPTVPANLEVHGFIYTKIGLEWTTSVDNIAVAGYRIFRDGIEIATTNATYYNDGGISYNITYIYTVSAYDAAGNESAQSSPASAMSAPLNVKFEKAISVSDFTELVGNTLSWVLSIAGSLALLIIIGGGVMYMTSVGDEQKVVQAKKIVYWTIIGLILILVAYSVAVALERILN